MRICHRYLTYDSHSKIIKPVKAVLDRYNLSYKYKEDLECVIPTFKYHIEFYLYEDNPAFARIKREIDKFDIEPQSRTIYEKADIEAADWFVVEAGEYQYPQPEGGFGYLKATFNLDQYCHVCGNGKVQNAPFRLKTEPKQYNNQFWGLHWESAAKFIRQETKSILEKEKIRGIRFSKPVLHKRNVEVEGFYQLHIDVVLDEGFDSYNTTAITCKIHNEENLNTDPALKYCGRIKFHHPSMGGYLFDKAVFNPDFDIVQSNEFFGSGGSAYRLQIVSKRFKQLVHKYKLKGLLFQPIVYNRFHSARSS